MRIFTKKLSFIAVFSTVAISGFLTFLPLFSSRNYARFIQDGSTSVENRPISFQKVEKMVISEVKVKDD